VTRTLQLLLATILSIIAMAAIASAQDNAEPSSSALPNGMDVTINSLTPLTTTLQLAVDGEVIELVLPGTLTINAQATIDDAALEAAKPLSGKRVGGILWEIEDIQTIGEKLERKFSDPIVSETGEFVVMSLKVRNLGASEYSMIWNTEVQALDDDGIQYETYSGAFGAIDTCDDINPGLAVRCEYLFEVPLGTKLVGLNVEAKEYGTVLFMPSEE